MHLSIKLALGFIALVLGVGVGARFLFAPVATSAEFGIVLEGSRALNQIRGDIGGVFVGLAGLTILGIVRSEPRFFEAVAICVLGVLTARVIGFVFDGGIDPESVVAAGLELIFAGVLFLAARRLDEPGASER